MQSSERYEDQQQVHMHASERANSRLWTSLPVVVKEDSDGFTVTVIPTIKGQKLTKQGWESVQMPDLTDVPVCWPQGGGGEKGDVGYVLTFPIKKDDEGIVVFSSRCIDHWWDKGKIQNPAHSRMHSLSDAMFIPGVRSKPRKVSPAPSKTTAQLRSDNQHLYCEITQEKAKLVYASDKGSGSEKETEPRMIVEVFADKIRGSVLAAGGSETAYFEMTSAGAFNGKAPQGVTWDAPFIRCTGEIIGKYTGRNIHLTTHTHSQGNDTHGDGEQEVNPPTSGS